MRWGEKVQYLQSCQILCTICCEMFVSLRTRTEYLLIITYTHTTDMNLCQSLAFEIESTCVLFVFLVFKWLLETGKAMNQVFSTQQSCSFNLLLIKSQLLTFTVLPCDISKQWESDDREMGLWRIPPFSPSNQKAFLSLNALYYSPGDTPICLSVCLWPLQWHNSHLTKKFTKKVYPWISFCVTTSNDGLTVSSSSVPSSNCWAIHCWGPLKPKWKGPLLGGEVELSDSSVTEKQQGTSHYHFSQNPSESSSRIK